MNLPHRSLVSHLPAFSPGTGHVAASSPAPLPRPEPLKILVVDDEPATVQKLHECCRSVFANSLGSVVTVDSLEAARSRLGGESFDALLLDPQFQDRRGMELLAGRTPAQLPTIIVSARTDLAVQAFECGAVDFLPKPFTPDRLALALWRVERRAQRPEPARPFLAVCRHGRIDLVAVEDLLYAEGADKYSELVLADGRRDLHDLGLARLEAVLPHSFVRIHKSYLVRFSLITRLRVFRGSRYFAELKTGQRLPVGRSRYRELKSRLI